MTSRIYYKVPRCHLGHVSVHEQSVKDAAVELGCSEIVMVDGEFQPHVVIEEPPPAPEPEPEEPPEE